MLDLKKLEESLEKALANETSESLTNWLQEKRLRSYLQSLGEGELELVSCKTNNNQIDKVQTVPFDVQYCEMSYSYTLAA